MTALPDRYAFSFAPDLLTAAFVGLYFLAWGSVIPVDIPPVGLYAVIMFYVALRFLRTWLTSESEVPE